MRVRHHATMAMVSLVLAGCAHGPSPRTVMPSSPPDPKVSYGIVPAGEAGRYQMKQGQTALGAEPVDHAAPSYPDALIAKNLPTQTVLVKIIVDASGRVSEVRDMETRTDADHPAFFRAVRDTTLHWRYTPMTIVQGHEDARGNYSETRSDEPFSLDYAFRFELKDGVPTVSATH